MQQGLELDAAFIDHLDRLSLIARRRVQGSGAGPRRSLDAGSSVEFADYRTYAPGDDFRRLDWNAYARLERLFLRIFEAEENTTLTLFVDCSQSMAGGEPAKIKLARQVAAALAYVALANYDRIAIFGVHDRLGPYLSPRSGRDRAPEVWRFVAELPVAGATALEALRAFPAYARGPGLSVVISDMLTDSNWRAGLKALSGAGRQEVTLLQILSPQELEPELEGDWRLVDDETGSQIEVSATPAVLSRYQDTLRHYTRELSTWCRGHRMHFAQISSAVPVDTVVLRMLRHAGVLR